MTKLACRSLLPLALLLVLAVPLVAAATGAPERRPLMRYPDVSGDRVVFSHGDDIWIAPLSGGIARRLTAHEGEERSPRFSPDGSLIAFTAEYDGNPDVYVMDSEGGDIRRVTWHPGPDEVVGWHPRSGKILFRSSRELGLPRALQLFLIAPDGSGLEPLPLPEAGWGSFSPDGGQIAYTRVATEDRTWKRYHGGFAPDVSIYDFATGRDRVVTDFTGTDAFPMWIGGKIYFNSDRDGVLNLWAYDVARGTTEQVTQHREFDARRPADGGGRIIYEFGGTLRVFDSASGSDREIPVQIRLDDPEVRPQWKSVSDFVTDVAISPTGERALLVARGEVFTVPREHGPARNLANDSGAREKDAAWSPDGKTIAFVSDKGGEYDIYTVDALGKSAPVRLTDPGPGYRHTLRWAPDGRKIAFADQTLAVSILDVATRKVTRVDRAEYEPMDVSIDRKPISDFAWSPDSRFLSYSKLDADLVSRLCVDDVAAAKTRCLAGGTHSDFNPVFTPDGEHIVFVSNRHFEPTYDDLEFQLVYKKVAGIYALTLRKGGAPLLPPRSDEEPAAPAKAKPAAEEQAQASAPRVVIDWEGLENRVEALPLPAGNYRELAVNASRVFFLDADEGDFNRFELRDLEPRRLQAFVLDERETKTIAEGVDRYRLSADGKRLVFRKGDTVVIAAADASDVKGGELDLSGLRMWLDPRAEWRQIYDEAWRLERDFYYDPTMQGLDWAAMRAKYARLLPAVASRADLEYVIGELIGELATSHTYVAGGERRRKAERVGVGMLGADYEIDKAANRYRFRRILRESDWTAGAYAPLARPGVDVREGDYLLEVNGADVSASREIYSYFQDLAKKQVVLLVNDRPAVEGAREVVVEPAGGESLLRYLDWVERNRRAVEEASGGRIGYVHLPDTFTGAATMFGRMYYAQTKKEGLILDGRFNNGGLDPSIFTERLARHPLAYWTRRYSHDQTTPAVATRAHMVCLTNRQAGSGGDMLPWVFREMGLGPVIGTRTWGGLVGVSMFAPTVDGGMLTAPDYRIYDTNGQWFVENVGVEPDIAIDLDPADWSRGRDTQLMKGVAILLDQIQRDPRPVPASPLKR
ncbi:MAG: PD40 domain-containing protein [Acidobacteria bacterium]|nr:PD40 domain-containing protein [Acidobacteriota bacterium]